MLIFTTKSTVTSPVNFNKTEKTKADDWKTVFFDIETLAPSLTIYGAYLLLKMSQAADNQYSIWYMEENHVTNFSF